MKIVHVTKKYPNALGGDAIVVSNLEKQQKKSGHKVAILTSNCDEIKKGKHIYKFGLKDTPAALDKITPKRLFSLAMLYFKAYKVLKVERPDVIHTHSIDMAFFISFAARHYRIPIVHSFHIVTFYDENQSLFRRKIELILTRAAKPQIITTPNSYDTKRLRGAGFKQAALLSSGIDLTFWQRVLVSKQEKTFTFVAAGRLEKQKGYEYLIRATALLKQETDTPFQVIIAGDGSLKNSLKELAIDLGVQGRIHFIGQKTASQLRTIYSTANAAIIPSLYETGPLSLLEAWAMQLPTIATPVGILAGATDNDKSILQIKPHNPESIASAMHIVMSGAKELVNYAQEKVRNYSWEKTNLILEDLYEKV